MTHMWRFALILLAAACTQAPPKPEPVACPACAACPVCPPPQPPKPAPEAARYVPASYEMLPGWSTNALLPSLRAFLAGCPRAPGALKDACDRAGAVPPGDEAAARAFFEGQFIPYSLVSSEGAETGLFTGYYEPIIDGSRTATPKYRYPIFGVPDDLVVVDLVTTAPETRNLRLRGRLDGRRLVPYASRAEIDARGAGFPAPILGWAADPVELFFLQIQGSGQLQLENGERTRIGYADQNGHPFRSMGRYLIDRGEMA